MKPITRTLTAWLLLASVATARQTPAPITGLDSTIERLDLVDAPLPDALRLISEESNVNLVASEEASKKTVTALLHDVTVRQALESITRSHGLWFRADEAANTVRVVTADEFEHDLVLFRDQETRVFTLLYPNAIDVALAIRNLFGERVRFTLDREQRFDDFDEINQRFQKFDLLEQRAQSLGVFSGGNTNVVGQNGQLFSNTNNNSFQRYANQSFTPQASQLREPPEQYPQQQQNAPELTPAQMEALQNAVDQANQSGAKGVDPGLLAKLRGGQTSIYVTIVRRNNMIAVRSSDRDAIEEVAKVVKSLDVPTPEVLLELRILSVDLGEDFHSVFDAEYGGANDKVQFTTGDIGANGGLVDPTAFVYRYVSDKFSARLQLLEERKRVTTLATPILLVANNEVARLFVGEERPIVRNVSTQTTVSNGVAVTGATPTVEIRPIGTTLLLTPNINADRTVTMRLIQETSSVKTGDADIPVSVEGGGVTLFPVDVVTSRTVNGTVVARDGLTLALGGLIQEGVTKNRSGVPGLMDVPYLGALFRRETEQRSRNELVILIRPLVLFTASEGVARSHELLDRLSMHPSAATLGEQPLDTFAPHEVPRGTPDLDRLKDALHFRSGTR